MRQVSTPPLYGIVGHGRLAKHLQYYFSKLEINYIPLSSYNFFNHSDQLKSIDIILLAIADHAIDDFLLKHRALLGQKTCIHFSGSITTELAFGFHPLMTFSKNLYSLEQYQSILFVKEDNTPSFKEVFPQLPNTCMCIKKTDKPYYHALCVLANNFSTLLWQKFFTEMNTKFNLPINSLLPFLKQTMENIEKDYQNALTGPLVRNDHQTIADNINALENDPFQAIYKSFIRCYKETITTLGDNKCQPIKN